LDRKENNTCLNSSLVNNDGFAEIVVGDVCDGLPTALVEGDGFCLIRGVEGLGAVDAMEATPKETTIHGEFVGVLPATGEVRGGSMEVFSIVGCREGSGGTFLGELGKKVFSFSFPTILGNLWDHIIANGVVATVVQDIRFKIRFLYHIQGFVVEVPRFRHKRRDRSLGNIDLLDIGEDTRLVSSGRIARGVIDTLVLLTVLFALPGEKLKTLDGTLLTSFLIFIFIFIVLPGAHRIPAHIHGIQKNMYQKYHQNGIYQNTVIQHGSLSLFTTLTLEKVSVDQTYILFIFLGKIGKIDCPGIKGIFGS
jgi:hypothetical protein